MLLLQVRNLTKKFGGLPAIRDLDLEVRKGEILGLIGPNGAGKTTLFNVITGVYPPASGSIIYKGEDITGLRTDKSAAKGIVRTFQLTNLFHNFTVLHNILVATHLQSNLGFWSTLFSAPGSRKREKQVLGRAIDILQFVGLEGVKDELAKNLPHGYQRSLGVAIALAVNPELLLLDEPMTGMNLEETKSMISLVKKIQEFGVTILLVEHNMKAVMRICDRIAVINFGCKIAEGSPEEISKNRDVIEAYLGGEDAT